MASFILDPSISLKDTLKSLPPEIFKLPPKQQINLWNQYFQEFLTDWLKESSISTVIFIQNELTFLIQSEFAETSNHMNVSTSFWLGYFWALYYISDKNLFIQNTCKFDIELLYDKNPSLFYALFLSKTLILSIDITSEQINFKFQDKKFFNQAKQLRVLSDFVKYTNDNHSEISERIFNQSQTIVSFWGNFSINDSMESLHLSEDEEEEEEEDEQKIKYARNV